MLRDDEVVFDVVSEVKEEIEQLDAELSELELSMGSDKASGSSW